MQTSWRLLYESDPVVSAGATKPYVQLVDYRSIQGQVFVIEETTGVQESTPGIDRVIEIAPRSEWSSIFLHEDWFMWIRNLYKKKKLKENRNRFIGYNGRRFKIVRHKRVEYTFQFRSAQWPDDIPGELDDENDHDDSSSLVDSENSSTSNHAGTEALVQENTASAIHQQSTKRQKT